MKIDSKDLKSIVGASVSPSKSPNEILRNTFLATKEENLVCITTNGVLSVRIEVPFSGDITPCLVPSESLKKVVKSKSSEIEISQGKDHITMKARSKYRLPSIPAVEFPFPEMITGNEEVIGEFDSESFCECLKTVANFLPENNSSNENIKAVSISEWNGKMAVFATDAQTMCLRVFSNAVHEECEIPMIAVAPLLLMDSGKTSVLKRQSSWSNQNGEHYDASLFFFQSENKTITASRPAYQYVGWKNVVKTVFSKCNTKNKLVVDHKELQGALADAVSNDEKNSQGMTVHIKPGVFRMSVSSSNGFSMEAEINCENDFESVFGARPHLMQRCIQSMHSDKVIIHILKELSMVVFQNHDDSDDFAILGMMKI